MSKSRSDTRRLPSHGAALKALRAHYLLGRISDEIWYRSTKQYGSGSVPKGAYCQLHGDDLIVFDETLNLSEAQWLGVFSLATLVIALGGARRLKVPSPVSDIAAQLSALHWWRGIKIGELPEHIDLSPEGLQWGRLPLDAIAARLQAEPVSELLSGAWTLTRSPQVPLMLPERRTGIHRYWTGQKFDPEQAFAQALVDNAKRALQIQHDVERTDTGRAFSNSAAARAWRWLISHYPLLGSLLTQFELIEDIETCRRMDIPIAAIHPGCGEIYINPVRGLSFEEAKFVIAHEALHAGLCHAGRRQGRDPFLWNVACDFVINDWLVSMNLGAAPAGGLLFDEELRGWAAEDIYLRLAGDLRARRKLSTFRGNACDLLDNDPKKFFFDREEFYRRALLQGLDYHQACGRGELPGGLVEAIRVLAQPPIPWQAPLAEWIRERFPLPLRQRTYARASRRQSSMPDTPRPRHVLPEEVRVSRTFGVVIDSSGSMDRRDLGKALGAVASYAQAQAVRQVRLVYCDAAAYDEGYVPIECLAARVTVRGRGGTVLQPAVNLLESRRDFPNACPILIITDGGFERDLTIRRDHAFLLAPGGSLPMSTSKPVFRMT
jgi:predicted metal-dependent peptidase